MAAKKGIYNVTVTLPVEVMYVMDGETLTILTTTIPGIVPLPIHMLPQKVAAEIIAGVAEEVRTYEEDCRARNQPNVALFPDRSKV